MAHSGIIEDLYQGSEEIPFTASKFTRLPDIDLESMFEDNFYIDRNVQCVIQLSRNKFIVSMTDRTIYEIDLTTSGRVTSEMIGWGRLEKISENNFISGCNTILVYWSKTNNDWKSTSIETTNSCLDVGFVDGYLVLTFIDGSVMIKQLKGKCQDRKSIIVAHVRGEYETHDLLEANRLMKNSTRYVSAVNENGTPVIYVSDAASLTTNQITKLSVEGKELMVYNDLAFQDAGPIAATGDGHLFVCFPDQCCIQLLTPDMDKGVTVLDQTDDISRPVQIWYNSEEKKMYILNEDSLSIMVFEIN